ncbi:glycosyltransferase family 2 protein [uncultured Mucilaginibacter sp.]|uniref:glycosyltransferase n=1 Tax=uncultured Mucilaginibacter sp. TaxID=797541 RepID=UPI0025D48B93|nr:glycosyltransferase family 2 protein [uncultured Mucilaginibacter sp.]
MIIVLSIIFIFLILRFVVTLFNFISDPKLRRVNRLQTDLVSILIPARNEENNIITLLKSIEQQEYTNYEVIVLDDDSTDRTFELCEQFAANHPKFRVVKGRALPQGWLGKNFACHQLAKLARGRFLLFLDADEKVYDDLINSAVHRIKAKNLALFSLFTNQEMLSLGEYCTVPLMHYLLLNLLPVRLIYISKNPSFAAASGQFMMFNADTYRQNQWHEVVKDRVVEDVELMKYIKAAKYKGESLLANGLITCRMYTNYTDAVKGFSKNFLAPFNYSIIGFIFYLLFVIGGPLVIISTLNLPLIIFMCGLIILSRMMISLSSGQNAIYNILLHPIQMLTLLIIGINAIQTHLTRKTVWKGRNV